MGILKAQGRRCEDCDRMVRRIPWLADHDPGCVILMTDPRTDKERAQVLAVHFENRSEHDPQLAEAAYLLRKVK